jgi:hypothetical protein
MGGGDLMRIWTGNVSPDLMPIHGILLATHIHIVLQSFYGGIFSWRLAYCCDAQDGEHLMGLSLDIETGWRYVLEEKTLVIFKNFKNAPLTSTQ